MRAVGTHYWQTQMHRAYTATPSEGQHNWLHYETQSPQQLPPDHIAINDDYGRTELSRMGIAAFAAEATRLPWVYCGPDASGTAGGRGRSNPAASELRDHGVSLMQGAPTTCAVT